MLARLTSGEVSAASEGASNRRLLEVGRALVSELDLDAVLKGLLGTARELTGARYAALGILSDDRSELSQFLVSGVDDETFRAIGDLPTGRGVLGELIEHPRPLRLADVRRHPSSYGFPASHPPMRTFLGVPVVIRGRAWGNLYLTEKGKGEFSEQDEAAAVVLAEWAAIAIDNARLYESSERRRQELEQANRGLEATRDVTIAIGEDIALEHTLELIAKRGRALVGARSVVIMLREGDELVVQTGAGQVGETRGVRLPIGGSTSGQVLERGQAERIENAASSLQVAPSELGVADAKTALLVPMVHRGAALGLLAAFDRGQHAEPFTADDEQLLRTFAASAATAVALAQSVQADRLHSSIAAADAERRRWARELHDETLQGLGALRVLLSGALRRADPERSQRAMREAVEQIEREIGNLHAIITELRPAALDELGLRAAIDALLDQHRERSGLEIDGEVSLRDESADGSRLGEDLETTVYRVLQEALTNVVKHARAREVRVVVSDSAGAVTVRVQDDGAGFDPDSASHGFGLAGMRERVGLIGGALTVDSGQGGTLLIAHLPSHGHQQRGTSGNRP